MERKGNESERARERETHLEGRELGEGVLEGLPILRRVHLRVKLAVRLASRSAPLRRHDRDDRVVADFSNELGISIDFPAARK